MTAGPFDSITPRPDQAEKIEKIRVYCQILLNIMVESVPASAERTLAFRHLEKAAFYANKAVCRDGERYLP